jgi:hypothetical protein
VVQFTDFSSNGGATGALADTGYDMPAIDYMWTKYNEQLIAASRTFTGSATYESAPRRTCAKQVWLHASLESSTTSISTLYTQAALGGHKFGDHRIAKTAFHTQVTPLMYTLSTIGNEIHYDDRLHRDSHVTGFLAKRITTILDGAPIYVKGPCDKPLAKTCCFRKSMVGAATRCRYVYLPCD